MPPPGSFRHAEVRRVSPGESSPDDVIIADTVCDLVAADVNAVMFMGNNPVPLSGGWRRGTVQAHLHSRLLRYTLHVYALGRGMGDPQEGRVWDIIQLRYGY